MCRGLVLRREGGTAVFLPVVERLSDRRGSVVEYTTFVVEMQFSVVVVCDRGVLSANADICGIMGDRVLILLCDSTG